MRCDGDGTELICPSLPPVKFSMLQYEITQVINSN
jgi:hypothetical protein